MKKKAFFVKVDDIIQFAKKGIVSKSLYDSKDSNISLFCFEEGQGLSKHNAPFEAHIFVIDGEGEFILGDETFTGEKGSFFVMPKGLPHAINATKKMVFLLTLVKEKREE
jgi:quercetin dioxygenase-like cupin family protein